MPQKLLNKREAAEMLNVSTRTINRLAAARRLKVFKVGNIFRVDPDEVERLKKRYTV